MGLPAPNLDDRTFQSLVDDAKRLVAQRCPEWTDHNVSDPGVTLIETFAFMVDQLLWRLNRVPERNYVKFLDLIGVRLDPPSAAHAPVTFWLSAPHETTVDVKAGTMVATPRSEEEAIVFTTLEPLAIAPCSLGHVASQAEGRQTDHTEALELGNGFHCFGDPPHAPVPGDTLYVGLSGAVPSCAVTLRFQCRTEGVGVDPRYPPIVWEAWVGDRWAACDVQSDATGGFNQPGDVLLHVPAGHQVHAGVAGRAGGWLRCRVVPHAEWQRPYQLSPLITGLRAFTVGGTTEAVNSLVVQNEVLGESDGAPAQRFALRHRPVVPGARPLDRVIEVSAAAGDAVGGTGWEAWTEVEDFAASGPADRHVVVDATAGEVVFGPAVREPDGSVSRYGAVPRKGTMIRIREYRAGGGRHGNVARGAISQIKSSIPGVDTVENRRSAEGGTDGEQVADAKVRGPLLLRTRQRAVTAEDYETLSLQASPEVARARCVPAGPIGGDRSGGPDAGAVRVLLVPAVEDGALGAVEFSQLVLPDEVAARVVRHLDERRAVGARVLVGSPDYAGLTAVVRLRAQPDADPRALEEEALRALYGYFHPLRGGPGGTGWPFGRSVVGGEVYAVLQRLPGVDFVEEVRLYPADPVDRRRGAQVDVLRLGPQDLVFSWGHHVAVEEP